jgi:hypothetical protein
MSIFGNILSSLGIGAHAKPAPDVRPYGPRTVPAGAPGTAEAFAKEAAGESGHRCSHTDHPRSGDL